MTRAFVLYAPNVHTGGGFVLLRALLAAWPRAVPFRAFLDARARNKLAVPGGTVSWVAPNAGARLKAEFGLRSSANEGSTVLCFHGLPPLLASRGQIIVFQQNRIYLGQTPLSHFAWKTRLRLTFERIVSRTFRHHVSHYLVQTPAMKRGVVDWWGATASGFMPEVKVMPFIDALPQPPVRANSVTPVWDFIYVSDGEAHKNHRALLAAWILLAQEGIRPSLALTLGPRDQALMHEIEAARAEMALGIANLGQMERAEVLALYARARAMIFPSTSESFGLPLIEASQQGLPILASELDFVRDVCVPAQTFDPLSPVSIARAVKRFMGKGDAPLALRTPAEFWEALLAGTSV